MILTAALLLCACTGAQTEQTTEVSDETFAHVETVKVSDGSIGPVEPVGAVPEALSAAVETNAFRDATAFPGGVLKTVTADRTAEVLMLDLYGAELARCQYATDDSHSIQTLTATSDGGFLFVSAFYEHALKNGGWNSEGGFASEIVKCSGNGGIEWTLSLPGCEGEAVRDCLEKDGTYYFFGSKEAPETKQIGVGSYTDVQILQVSRGGELENTVLFSGSDFDWYRRAEPLDDGFLLYLRSQSSDGDFAYEGGDGYSKSWQFVLDDSLRCVSKTQEEDDVGSRPVRAGTLGGKTVYRSDAMFSGYDAGDVRSLLDYGSFYLVVSHNLTEELETPPEYNTKWYESETVYSAFDKTGKLLWRAAVANP